MNAPTTRPTMPLRWSRARTIIAAAAAALLLIAAVVVTLEWANPEPRNLPGTIYDVDSPIAVTDDLLIGSVEKVGSGEAPVLRAVELDGGGKAWEQPMHGEVNSVEDGVLVLGDQNRWTGVDLATGEELWTVQTTWTITPDLHARASIVGDGTVVITRSGNGLSRDGSGAIAVDARTGKQLWTSKHQIVTTSENMREPEWVYQSSRVIEWNGYEKPMTVLDARSGEAQATLPYSRSFALTGQGLAVVETETDGGPLTTVYSIPGGERRWEGLEGVRSIMVGSPGSTTCIAANGQAINAVTGDQVRPPAPWVLEDHADGFECGPWALVVDDDAVALWNIDKGTIKELPDRVSRRRDSAPSWIVANGENGAVTYAVVQDFTGLESQQTDVWFGDEHSAWRSEPLVAIGGFDEPRTAANAAPPILTSLWTDHGYLAFKAKDGIRLVDLEP